MSASSVWITPDFSIPPGELELTFVRSSGPGGQNVNKVNSKARLRWNVFESPSVPEALRDRLLARLGGKLTVSGDLILTSDVFRDQLRNREDCLEKFRELLVSALKTHKKRKATKPSRSSIRKVKEKKKHHAERKASRKRVQY